MKIVGEKGKKLKKMTGRPYLLSFIPQSYIAMYSLFSIINSKNNLYKRAGNHRSDGRGAVSVRDPGHVHGPSHWPPQCSYRQKDLPSFPV
jgi:hypothetical protein